MVLLPVSGTFGVHIDVDTLFAQQQLCEYHKRVCTGSWLWDENPLPHRAVLHLAFQSDALPSF